MSDVYINFSTQGQKLIQTETVFVASGAAKMVKAKFALDDSWTGLTVYGRFKQGFDPLGDKLAYDVPLDNVKSCSIPHEVLAFREFNVCLVGEDSTGNRLTTDAIRVKVAASIDGDIGQPDAPTESVFQQIKDSEAARVAAEEERQEAEAARVTEFANLKSESESATAAATAAAANANNAAQKARGNILTGTASGLVVNIEDAYAGAMAHEVRVNGTTRQNLWVNPSGTKYGMTVTSNDDGSIAIDGTVSGGQATVSLTSYNVKPSTTYCFSCDKVAENSLGFLVRERNGEGSQIASHWIGGSNGNAKSVTFTTSSSCSSLYILFGAPDGATVSGTYRIMLNEGGEAQPWCPPGLNSVDEVSLVTAGKNLVSTSESSAINFQLVDYFLPAGEYTLSIGDMPDGFRFNIRAPRGLGIGTSNDTVLVNVSSSVSTFTLGYASPLFINGYSTPATPLKDIQLELGSTATAYEPPSVTFTPIDLDGHALRSLPDGTRDELAIGADGGTGVAVRCAAQSVAAEDWALYQSGYGEGTDLYRAAVTGGAGRQADYDAMLCDAYAVTNVSTQAQPANTIRIAHAGDSLFLAVPTGATPVACECVYALGSPTSADLTAVTLPALPAPDATVWAECEPPTEISLKYERDLTIAYDNLCAAIIASGESTN